MANNKNKKMYPMRRKGKSSVKQAGGQLKPDRFPGNTDLSPHRNKDFMISKPFKIVESLTIVTFFILIGLYCYHQGTKSHLDAQQAEFYVRQIIDNKYDRAKNDALISKRTAMKIADKLFSEKYGNWHAFLYKPFDIYLINGYWFVYGPISKSKLDYGPMIIINYYTGETRFKPGYN
jgi:hypothetical protein